MLENFISKIITYNSPLTGKPDQCYCQLKFDDGLRILISQSNEGIKIYKLFLGIVPRKILYHANFLEHEKHEKFTKVLVDSPLLMDSYVETIKLINNSKDFLNLINS